MRPLLQSEVLEWALWERRGPHQHPTHPKQNATLLSAGQKVPFFHGKKRIRWRMNRRNSVDVPRIPTDRRAHRVEICLSSHDHKSSLRLLYFPPPPLAELFCNLIFKNLDNGIELRSASGADHEGSLEPFVLCPCTKLASVPLVVSHPFVPCPVWLDRNCFSSEQIVRHKTGCHSFPEELEPNS